MTMQDFALQLLEKNPNIANNPRAKHMVEVIKSGDSSEGEKLAKNLCQTYGVSEQDAVKQAMSFFNLN